MNNKLIVMYEEDVLNPKNTWSGTSFQLREALKEYYEIIFVDSYDILPLKALKTISKYIERRNVSIFFKPLYEKLHEIEINTRIKKYKDIPVLEICENVDVKNDYYLYRDMAYACYPYVLDKLKNDNIDYGHGMLNFISTKALKQRIIREEKLHNKAKGVFFMGQWIVDKMKMYYPQYSNKFIHAGGGFNNELVIDKVNNKTSGVKRILFVGIDFKRKGGDLLIEAYKQLKSKYQDKIELIIAGPNIVEKEDGIVYIGKKSRKELSEIFSMCDLFCMPSRFEAYGLVFIEALCYGLPIVAYDDFEMKYFVENGKNGYLLKNHDSNELSNLLEKALFSNKINDYVKKNNKHYCKQYKWSEVAKIIRNNIDY